MSLIRNSFLNVAGAIVPAVVGLPAIGYLARTLGPELFGLLTLAWALVGYATLFDMGLSRAVSQYVAVPAESDLRWRTALGTATTAVLVSGIVLAFILYFASAHLVDSVFNVTAGNRFDAIAGTRLLGISVPFLLSTLIINGYLEGRELFVESNWQKTVGGCLLFLVPVLCVSYVPTFRSAVLGLISARVFTFFLALLRCNKLEPLRNWRVSLGTLRELGRFGCGIAITNTISPVMGYLDRFLLSSIHGAQHVSYYTGAAELVSRLSIIPVAISRALFPKLVGATNVSIAKDRLVCNARMYTAISCVPVAVFIFVFAEAILRVWLGPALSHQSGPVLQVLVIGFVFNAFAQIPFSAIQARGESFLTAKIQMFEVLPYVLALFYLGGKLGAMGVAMAWTMRIAVDLVIMEFYSRKCR